MRNIYAPTEFMARRTTFSVNMVAKHKTSALLADAYMEPCHHMNRYAKIPKTLYLSLYLAVPSLGRCGINVRGMDLKTLWGERAGGLGSPWDCGMRAAMSRLFVQKGAGRIYCLLFHRNYFSSPITPSTAHIDSLLRAS